MNAPARVLNLLHAARPEDVAPVLSLLSKSELAAGLASDYCDPDLRALPPDRKALRHALLNPRPATEHLLTEHGAAQDAVRLAARAPYQRVLPEGVTPYGRPQADLSRQLRARLAAVLGDEPLRWYGVLATLYGWERSLAELLDLAASRGPAPARPTVRIRHGLRQELFLPGVLLAMAPAAVIAGVLAYDEQGYTSLIEALFTSAPYHPGYFEHALGPAGSDFARERLCAGFAKPLSVAYELLERGVGTEDLTRLTATHGDLALRLRIYHSLAVSEKPWGVSNLGRTKPEQIHALLASATTAEDLLRLITELRPLFQRTPGLAELRLPAYLRLAQLAGPEPVWSAELDFAGSLELMHEGVRASMATGDLAPLVTAADAVEPPGPPPPQPNQGSLTDWPLEDAVCRRLDGRKARWRAVLRLAEDDSASVLDIVQKATGRSVRPAGPDIEDLKQDPKNVKQDPMTPLPDHPRPAKEDSA
ncbi:hypothetical protein KGQ20_30780 [Catenulispora sp. NF23]|uniref:Uncharacterized protein n=1 Tax=Catenulispora pinistramenti TaxID=2705254 RepID=A0ABS5L1K4_9ACTN|nr:hypothetical protein [Catenulispora pinistramenti]MBS2537151.1 hypothetical protein [Catenulispora pinistramenti]MBS2552213.1 hypothetical protein [Catenulispora pinistramenti]